MRKKEREISDRTEIAEILARAVVCRIALSANDSPYIVPVCFAHQGDYLYFHCAAEGRKIEILRKNNRVCFEVDIDCEVVKSPQACSWGMRYRSVVGFGLGFILENDVEKKLALDLIMQHYGEEGSTYGPEIIRNTTIVKIVIQSMTGKRGRV